MHLPDFSQLKPEDEGREDEEAEPRQEDEEDWDNLGHDPALEDAFEGLKLHGEEEKTWVCLVKWKN